MTIHTLASLLNDLLELDRAAVSLLVGFRAACRPAIADHATVQILRFGNNDFVGFLGILNGVFLQEDSQHVIVAVYKDDVRLSVARFKVRQWPSLEPVSE